jgi:hypothetical protein
MAPASTDPGFDIPVDPSLYSGGCWTIDATTITAGADPNRYLDYARACKPGAIANHSAVEAGNALLASAGSATNVDLHIVGHGNLGKIMTGSGLYGGDLERIIEAQNIDTWRDAFKPLRGRAASLRLWSCNSGQGDSGVELLAALASVLDCPCCAPIGMIECFSPCGFALETGSGWQSKVPGKPDPKAAYPRPMRVNLTPGAWSLQVAPTTFINLNEVVGFQIDRGDGQRPWSGPQANQLLQQIDVARPIRLSGGLGAIITASLTISYRQSDGSTGTKTFSVYNDKLVKSNTDPTYYWCDDRFVTAAFT